MEGWILIVVLCMVGRTQSAIDNSGTEFMIAFMDNYMIDESFDVEFYVTTASNNVVEVTITTPLYNASWVTKVNATRRNIANFTVPTGIRGKRVALEGKGIYISATEEVTIYCVNKEAYSTDAFIAYPIDSVGTDYIAVTWDLSPIIMVAGITDGTDVTFKFTNNYSESFTYNGIRYSAGGSLTVTVDRYQTFHIYSNYGDLTGTRITSTNPVSAFSGNLKTSVRDIITGKSQDHLVEQLVATQSLGKEFISFAMPERTVGDFVRIIAAEDSTTYSIDGASYTLNMNMYNTHNLLSSSYYWIKSDKGISVVMFSKTTGVPGYNDAPNGGDPCMSLAVPVALFGSDYTWSTVTTTLGDFYNYILIVSLAKYTSDLVLDDVSLTANWTFVTGNSDYVATFVTISPGAHSIYNSVPIHGFLGMALGNAPLNSYAYASGLRLASINLPCHTTSTTNGDGYDNDCDGRIDEEIENGVDDDNDGLIDEDLSLGVRVNGEWGNWAAWGTCSNTCGSGSGVYVRSRMCDNPAPADFGLDCVGDDYETGVCTGPSSPCPIDGSWGQWGNWSVCSVTCDSGLQLRTRPCDDPEPQYGGLKCTGDSTENTTCENSEYCLPVFYGNPLSGCTENKFACANGSACIDIALRCDGQVDCADGTDESNFYTGCALSHKSGASILQASVFMVMLTLLLMLVKG